MRLGVAVAVRANTAVVSWTHITCFESVVIQKEPGKYSTPLCVLFLLQKFCCKKKIIRMYVEHENGRKV